MECHELSHVLAKQLLHEKFLQFDWLRGIQRNPTMDWNPESMKFH